MKRTTLAGIRLPLPILAGAGDPPAPPAPTPTPPAPTPPAPAPAPPAPTPPRTFTQEEVDRMVTDRLSRDRRDRLTEEEEKELREAKKRLDKLEADQLTEKERLEKEAKDAKDAAEQAKNEAAETTQKSNARLIRAEIIAAAASAGAIDSSEVYALLKEKGFAFTGEDSKKLEVTLSDDGEVTGAKEVVTAFLATKKHLVGTTHDPGPGGGGAHPKPTPKGDLANETDPKRIREYARGLAG